MPSFSLLVFDSHPALLSILVRHIQEHHAEWVTVAGAAFRETDALELAATVCPQVVLLGICGPTQDAFRLIAALQCLVPEVIVVATSHLGTAGYWQAALDAGADTFVDKDHLKAGLVPAILEAAHARHIVPSTAATARYTLLTLPDSRE